MSEFKKRYVEINSPTGITINAIRQETWIDALNWVLQMFADNISGKNKSAVNVEKVIREELGRWAIKETKNE